MPSFMMHSYFAVDTLNSINIDNKHKKQYEKDIDSLKVFAQGSDYLLVYNLVTLGFGKKIRKNYQKQIHSTHTKDFLIELISYIKENKMINNTQSILMLYGYICHYVLDSIMHPYISFKTGEFNKKDINTYKYNGKHTEMEVFLDCYMIYTREKVLPKDFKIYKDNGYKFKLDKKVKEMIDIVIKKIYNYNNYCKVYEKSIKHMYLLNRIFRYDKYGIKKFIYKTIDLICPKKSLKKEYLSYNTKFKKQMYYLNLDRNDWNNPIDKSEVFNQSVIELYKIALNKSTAIINQVNLVLFDNAKIDTLDKYITNISLKNGKDCSDNRKMKYFEY